MKSHLNISLLYQLIDENNYSDFFDRVSDHVPEYYQNSFNQLRKEFYTGNKDSNFDQRLKTLTRAFLIPKKHLTILVLTCNLSQIKGFIGKMQGTKKQKAFWAEFENKEMANFYGEELNQWKPYKEETIVELLDFFKSKFEIEVNYKILSFDKADHAFDYIEKIDSKIQEMVLVGDIWAFHHEANVELAKKFDSKNMRGCVVPIFEDLDREIKNYLKNMVNTTFKTLCRCAGLHHEYGTLEDTGFVYIDLEVPNKHAFFRKLKHIVYFNPVQTSSFTDLQTIAVPNIRL